METNPNSGNMSPASCPPAGASRGQRWTILRVLLVWLTLYAVALTAYNLSPTASGFVTYRLQVVPAGWLIQLTLPDVPISLRPASIVSPSLRMDILRGCDGVEPWLLMMTALLAMPSSWRRRLGGVAVGTLLIFSLNLLRIVSLFHLTLHEPAWFEVAHGVVWQSVMVLAASIFSLAWMGVFKRPHDTGDRP
ncbi:MAG TPA: archaeosortase/exosortase family protein [Kiritimatiellia bacterium]|nr:archaeosortase/exosortase family protein [Kiritimatiellia bacterium]HMO99692.1 archaeosortase/exosortase family protein [Kiritimatiellia bacterium]HMP96134.1 archaeosortase/exosortase family protein [Kiritimatiellia bacterium]